MDVPCETKLLVLEEQVATLTAEIAYLREEKLNNLLCWDMEKTELTAERDRLLRAVDDFWAMWKDPEAVMAELDEDGRWAMEQARERALAGTGETT